MFPFFTVLARNVRTGTAEFFLALIVLLILDKSMDRIKKAILLIIFTLSLIVSHYGTSYLFMLALFFVLPLFFWIKSTRRFDDRANVTRPTFVALYTVFALSWYIYNSNSSTFNTVIRFTSHTFNTILTELTCSESSYTIYAITRDWPLSVEVSRNLLSVFIFFIVIDVLSLIWFLMSKKDVGLNYEYAVFSIVFLWIIIATFLPIRYFNPARIIHISLCFLAPFCVTGCERAIKNTLYIIKSIKNITISKNGSYKIFSVLLAVFLLFNSGFASEVIIGGTDYSPSTLLHKERALEIRDPLFIHILYNRYFPEYDVFGARWLSTNRNNNIKIGFFDYGIGWYPLRSYGMIPPESYYGVIGKDTELRKRFLYIYLRYHNCVNGVAVPERYCLTLQSLKFADLDNRNKIYTNGGSEIYYR